MIAVITCFFNPLGVRRRIDNYRRFEANMRKHCKVENLFVAELSFSGAFEIEDAFIQIEGGFENLMWQKERLLNLIVDRLPERFDTVAWIDADIEFDDPDWWKKTDEALNEGGFDVVQPFRDCRREMSPDGTTDFVPSAGFDQSTKMTTTGLAWAARRSIFPLYDRAIVGGGDKIMCNAFTHSELYIPRIKGNLWHHFTGWREGRFPNPVSFGYIEGRIAENFHGVRENRCYRDRHLCLHGAKFDPTEDIALNDDGIWEWNRNRTGLQRNVARYFFRRKEGGE